MLKEISVANIEQSARERLVKFVKDEIKALNTCDHDNVVRYICDFYKDQQFQIIMEYCKNGDLRLAIMNQKRSGCHFDVEKGKSLSFLFVVMSFIVSIFTYFPIQLKSGVLNCLPELPTFILRNISQNCCII